MAEINFDELLQFFKVLGNESRLRLVGLLANGERSVGDLAAALELTEPTVSHHLAQMKKLGLVDVRAEGTVRFYRLDVKFLERMNRDIFSQDKLASLAPEDGDETAEQKVLRQYVRDGRIIDIPAKAQRLKIVLAWLAEQFEPDTQYTELELNRRLKELHPDFATLRRGLVDFGFMERDKGVYWRKG